MNKLFRVIGGFLLSLIVVTTTINIGHGGEPKSGGELKIGMLQFPQHFNSAIQSGVATMFPGAQIFASLLEFDDKWQPVPYLAKSWEISEDSMTYTFHLVEGATFHDGKPITSEDVSFSFETVKKNHSFGPSMFGPVDRVETPDSLTAVFKLDRHHPALLLALSPALMPIIPKHIYSTDPIRTHPANTEPIGSGPFKLVEFKPGDYYILERNENYFRPGLPYIDRLIVIKAKDASANQIAFENGEFHYGAYSGGMRLQNISRLKKVANLEVTRRGYEAIGPIDYLEFNLRKPPFNDIRVRRAIAHAVDKDFITQKLQLGLSAKATGPLVHMFPFYTDEVTLYDYNLDKANKLLDEAGYPRKNDGVRFSTTITWYPGDIDNQQMLAEYFKSTLRKVGIDVKLRHPPDFGSWVKWVSSWEYDLTMNAIFSYADPIIGVHRLYRCDNIKNVIWTNTAGYCNPKVDEILKKAESENDFEKRKELYHEFQKIMTEDLPLVFTHELPYHTIYHKDLRDTPLGIWGSLSPFDKMYWKDGLAPK